MLFLSLIDQFELFPNLDEESIIDMSYLSSCYRDTSETKIMYSQLRRYLPVFQQIETLLRIVNER